jgi:hypothetical protein
MRYWPDHARADERWLATNRPHGHQRKHARHPVQSTVRTIRKAAQACWRLLHRTLVIGYALARDSDPQPGLSGFPAAPRPASRRPRAGQPPLGAGWPDRHVLAGRAPHRRRLPPHRPIGGRWADATGRGPRREIRVREGRRGAVRHAPRVAERVRARGGRRYPCKSRAKRFAIPAGRPHRAGGD